jgi:uncharacterized protein YcbX
MKVAELWRYPVKKTMAGEKLQQSTVGALGKGDRVVHAEDTRGRRARAPLAISERILGHACI